MIYIDHPYVSDYIKKTILGNSFNVVDTPQARELLGESGSYSFITPEEALRLYSSGEETAIYTNSENGLGDVAKHLDTAGISEKIAVFKNKILFRDHTADQYPDFFYTSADLSDLTAVNPAKLRFPCIVKPAIGFFSVGVHKVNEPGEWDAAVRDIQQSLTEAAGTYPEVVLNSSQLIIEECIEGEEFAFDAYFDESGNPVILGIFKHLFSSEDDLSDRIYITSGEILADYLEPFTEFLKIAGSKSDLKNFPLHAEVRISEKYGIIPIEINPLRFGGWCSLPDISKYAYGFNQYEYFFANTHPDWNMIQEQMGAYIYSIIVLDNSTGMHPDSISSFDAEALIKTLSEPLEFRSIDAAKYNVFGFVFAKTHKSDIGELYRLLQSDLKEFILLPNILT
ncbi:MAG: ATP-grasp domain-containing protein [Bacteroidetes bacterium]|nr:ATP-grasp domain-containing protein [Bacteroidota bacterium]